MPDPQSKSGAAPSRESGLNPRARRWVAGAALLALFLGALDALIIAAAMPSIVADLGGMHLFSWAYSAYMLARAVALPIAGKLGDLWSTRRLLSGAIILFMAASLAAGCVPNMALLITARVFQGIGAGAIFALVYAVLTDAAQPGRRAQALALASFVWGLASVSGPTLGGFLVAFFNWRWVFFINIPLGTLALWGIARYLVELREKKARPHLDLWGAATLSVTILALLSMFLMAGRTLPWLSLPVMGLMGITLLAGLEFIRAEKRAPEPILNPRFFQIRGFSTGNGAMFLSSFAVFSLFAYGPLYIQGTLGMTPVEVGWVLLALSLGWSVGSWAIGGIIDRLGHKRAALMGAGILTLGCGLTLTFHRFDGLAWCFAVFLLAGVGMGFVSLATLLIVQNSVDACDLGVVTASTQLARTLGGTVGVGVCGGVLMTRLQAALEASAGGSAVFPREEINALFHADTRAQLPADLLEPLQHALTQGLGSVFAGITTVSLLCFWACALLPAPSRTNGHGQEKEN